MAPPYQRWNEFPRRRSIRITSLVFLVTLLLSSHTARSADAPDRPIATPTLHLASGDFAAGNLVDCDRPNTLRWQCAAFATPFDFPVGAVSSIHFPLADQRPKAAGNYGFEFVGGDLLFGSLLQLSTKEAVLDLPHFGRVHVRRDRIRRLFTWRDGEDLIYLGPNGLSDWEHSKSKKNWREESGQLLTDQDEAFLQSTFQLPTRARVELEISWTTTPDFVIALGVDDDAKCFQQAFRFEVWDQDVVALRETTNDADVASLAKIPAGAGRIHLQAYLDRKAERLIVFSDQGRQLADLQVSTEKVSQATGIRLVNNRGNVRLEQLQVTRWNGERPQEVQATRSHIQLADGSLLYGEVKMFDAGANQFVVDNGTGETRIDLKDAASIVLEATDDSAVRSVRAAFLDGARLSGNLMKVERGRLWLTCPGVTEPLSVPVAELHSLLMLDHQTPSTSLNGRVGRLETEGMKLSGALVDNRGNPDASCLAWHARGSTTASPLRRSVSARIVYRDPPLPKKVIPAGRRSRPLPGFWAGLARALSGGSHQATPNTTPLSPSLHLRAGDTIPCKVTRIDERGVTFQTPISDATFVTHDKVKAVELAAVNNTIQVDRAKRERLLTLPRIQKQNPPTHLICSTGGDYLRARLNAMDDKTLTVEVRLETKQLRRDKVARIIWLHDDELDTSDESTAGADSSPATRVQAVRSDGSRLTFFPDRQTSGTLSGRSELLGACRVDLKQVDRLLIGGAIEQAAAQLTYQQWTLHNAVEPKFVNADGGPGTRTPGTESSLVGQPAPDFELGLLDGKRFRLSDHRGSVVVLDFWTSWCGPCIQAMPQVDRLVNEFQDENVVLIAVNIEETEKRIAATLERLQLNTTVALDRDGAVAREYGAVAIPQTVVIDRDGTIVRLFFGGRSISEQLRDVLEGLIFGNSRKTGME